MPVAEHDEERTTLTLPIQGMTCAACQTHVERALRETSGVEDATVNLMTHTARVVFNPRLTAPASLVAAVHDAGTMPSRHAKRARRPPQDTLARQQHEQYAHEDPGEERFSETSRRLCFGRRCSVHGAIGTVDDALDGPLSSERRRIPTDRALSSAASLFDEYSRAGLCGS